MSLDFAKLISQVKQEKQALSVTDGLAQVNSQGINQQAMQDIQRTMLMALGLGAAGRGVAGLVNTARRQASPLNSFSGPVEVPVAVAPKDEKEKMAQEGGPLSFFGSPVTQKEGLPWHLPGMLLGGAAAGYAGWKGVDAVLDKRRRETLQDELEESRNKFKHAILGPSAKIASDGGSSLSAKLDAVYALFEKAAEEGKLGPTWGDRAGQGLGMYGAYAIPAALLTGYATYAAGAKRQRRAVLEDAVKFRQRQRYLQQPTSLYVKSPDEEEAAAPVV